MNIEFLKKHINLFTFLGLCLVFYFIFICGIGTYPLMDIDETRYAAMAKEMFGKRDFLTLYLNNEYFFEKPPLYFWLECLSLKFLGANEFAARFPVAILGIMSSFMVYFTGKKVISNKFGIYSALILATSAEFFILAKFAILDIVLCFCTTFSIFFGFMTFFCEEKNKKYFWWLFYIFSGLAVLAKGIPGFVLPFGVMFFSYLTAKKFKELFKPVYFLPGVILFLLIVLPWHIIMLQKYDHLFFDEYIMKHHIARFTTSAEIGRKQPFYFFILTILVGFFPWIFPFLTTCKNWILQIKDVFKGGFDFQAMNNSQKFITLNIIAAVFTLLFFSVSSSKLVTYILPIYPFLACLTAKILTDEKNSKHLEIFCLIFGWLFLTVGYLIPISFLFLNNDIKLLILNLVGSTFTLIFISLILLIPSVFIILLRKIKNGAFSSIVLFMLILSVLGIPIGFNIDYSFGQNDLMKFAEFAKTRGKVLASFGFGRRFSLLYYYDNPVIFEEYPLYDKLNNLLKDENTVIVVKNKNLPEHEKNAKFTLIEKGVKYSLIKG